MKVLIVFFAFMLIAAGCSNTSTEPKDAKMHADITLKQGEFVKIESEGIELNFFNVTEDSRCPKGGAQCVWEGQASIAVNVKQNGKSQTLNIISRPGQKELSADTFAGPNPSEGYVVVLKEIKPYPELGKEIKLEEYVAVVIVSNVRIN